MFKNIVTTTAITLLTMSLSTVTSAKTIDVNYASSVNVFLSLQKDVNYNESVDEYTLMTSPESIIEKSDEFEKESETKSAIKKMKQNIAAVSKNDVYVSSLEASFKEYNFEKQAFDFKPFKQGSFVNAGDSVSTLKTIPNNIKYVFMNPDFVDGFPMPKEKAKEFISKRKLTSGVDRDIKMDLYLMPIKLKEGTQVFSNTQIMVKIIAYQIRDLESNSLLFEKKMP